MLEKRIHAFGFWFARRVFKAGGDLRVFAVRRSAASGRMRGLDLCGQAIKGAWGMSWRQEALKGVEDCEKLGGAVKRVLIPRYPN